MTPLVFAVGIASHLYLAGMALNVIERKGFLNFWAFLAALFGAPYFWGWIIWGGAA